MIGDIRQRLNARPFEPFVVVTSGGTRHRVASAEHVGINPQGNRVMIWFDDGSGVDVAGLHIVTLERDAPQAA